MRQDLPSLTALLAFEASARLLSFKHAAEELGVSAAAVSRQIRNLEDYIGQPLFRRLHRRVELNQAGETLFISVNRGFADMANIVATLRQETKERQVTVGCTGGFAFYWLMPRLGHFSARHPDITVNQVVTDEPIDITRGDTDLAVRYGTGEWPQLDSHRLFDDRITPVCSRAYIAEHGAPHSVADLAGHPLFDSRGIDGDSWLDWSTWFRLAGHPVSGVRGTFLNYLIGVQMALDGQGYALGWQRFVGQLIEQGRLVTPLGVQVPSPGAFFLTVPKQGRLSTDAQLFADWLLEEAAR